MLGEILGWDIVLALVALVVLLATIALPVWAIVDIARRPESAFERAGQSKSTWLVLIIVLTLFCSIPGLVVTLVYLFSIRPKLESA